MKGIVRFAIAGGLTLWMAGAARAQLTSFTTIDYPSSTATGIIGLNDAGDMVGFYNDRNNRTHGFLLKDGKFTSLDPPGSTSAQGFDINAAGDIVGFYTDANQVEHGFLLRGGRFTAIDPPGSGAGINRAAGINAKGDIVGVYAKAGVSYGYLLSGGRFTEIQHPEARDTFALGINDQGEIAGAWIDASKKYRGFRLNQGKFTTFEFPGALGTAIAIAHINSAGDIVTPYSDARNRRKGLLLRGGRYTTIDVPGASGTSPYGINASGQVAGAYSISGVTHGFLTSIAPPFASQPILVDDDGADCPGSVSTIQEAVRRAAPGATILVCRGIYTGAVSISGPEKDGLKLIALGRTHDVILQGDYLERDGFHLENVSNVLIRGFTVRDFGNKATTATEWGAGDLIHLENAHYNTIEHNQLIDRDRAGVSLLNSGNNVVQQNVASAINSGLATCGIEVKGVKSAANIIRLNMIYGNKLAGIMIGSAGPGNVVTDNTVVANGRFGIDVQNTSEVWVEGNRVSYSRGYWGTTPGGQQPGVGLNLASLLKATVFDNRARSNTGTDLNWDGKGDNRLEANACDTVVPAGACGK